MNIDTGILISIIGALVIVTNIITEVFKKLLPEKFPTNITATLISMILTLISFFAYTSYKNISVEWYYVVATVIVGFMVAYAAMFGFDKLKQLISQINQKE